MMMMAAAAAAPVAAVVEQQIVANVMADLERMPREERESQRCQIYVEENIFKYYHPNNVINYHYEYNMIHSLISFFQNSEVNSSISLYKFKCLFYENMEFHRLTFLQKICSYAIFEG